MAESKETIISEASFDTPRRIRVYDDKGDFFIDIPAGCRLTFGYFNPATSGVGSSSRGWSDGPGAQTMKTTCLRVYSGKGDKDQLAAFLGVKGFRDETIKLTRIVERVTVERKLADDGEGTVEWGGKHQRELTASREEDTFF